MDQESHEGVLKKVLGGNALMADSFVDHPPDVTNMAWMGKIFFVTVYKGDNNATVSMKGVHQMQHLLRIVCVDNEVNLMKIQAEIDEKK